ncbi:MAG TPA: cell division protein FtsL [Candidatus Tectomicrobia bacterium]|nr:cell division protein FtsL [Candidatus Tectomicrobia bacterium]
MVRATPVRQSSSPGTSPRRLIPLHRAHGDGQRSTLPQRFRFAPLLVSLFLCLAGVGVYMWPRVQVVRLAYRLQTSEQRLRELLQERDQLRFELASLRDPQRIYRVAIDQLGMSTPQHDQVVIVTQEPRSR